MTTRKLTRVRSRSEHQRDERREQLRRMELDRRRRQRLVEAHQSEEAAAAVAAYRVERARREEIGKPVLPTIDEWRAGKTPEPVFHLGWMVR